VLTEWYVLRDTVANPLASEIIRSEYQRIIAQRRAGNMQWASTG
jgi:hypothetical protein